MKIKQFLNVSLMASFCAYSINTQASVKISTGYLYVDGQNSDLDSSNSTLTAIPLSLKFKNDALSIKLSSSRQELNSGNKTTNGLGDTSLKVSYRLTPSWTVSLKEKFSTGDKTKGLSTGYNDTTLQVGYSKALSEENRVFSSLSYKIKGGKSDIPNYKNAASVSVGLSRKMNENWRGGISLNYSQASNIKLDDTLGTLMFLGHKINKNWGVNSFIGTDNIGTQSLGLSISYKIP
jgi:long-subunit fatty acid transport protein